MSHTIRMTAAPGVEVGPQALRIAPPDTSVIDAVVGGSIDSVRGEIDDAFDEMGTFHNNEPDYCMRIISGHSARLSYIATKIRRIEDWAPDWRAVREREIDPALRELERQYESASRRHTIREFEWKMEMGER